MRSPKRRRLGDRDDAVQYESSSASSGSEEEGDASDNVEVVEDHATATADQTSQYDPHQPMQERRELRKSMRAMDKDLQDRRNELSAPDSKELEVMIKRQNVHFGGVKQTSDATIDSRFLVNAGEITYKRTKSLNVGENAQTVDVEEFIGKCIVHMKDAAERDVGATQRRRRAAAADDDDEEDMEQGDALDWSFFGAQACMPVNVRPPVIGFLLGPLSVQKRARAPRVRRERLQRAGPVETVYAKEMRAEELGQYGTSSLTAICTRIRAQFHQAHSDALDFMNEFWEGRDEEEQLSAADRTLMEQRNALMGDGGLSLFKFAINPHDFGQTVENLFYISFLIRDDAIQIKLDADGLPSMRESFTAYRMTSLTNTKRRRRGRRAAQRRQPQEERSQTPSHLGDRPPDLGGPDRAPQHCQTIDTTSCSRPSDDQCRHYWLVWIKRWSHGTVEPQSRRAGSIACSSRDQTGFHNFSSVLVRSHLLREDFSTHFQLSSGIRQARALEQVEARPETCISTTCFRSTLS